MKFASRLGVGEVVICRTKSNLKQVEHELLLKVVAITFNLDGSITVVCRHPVSGQLAAFCEEELEGDPNFDQVKGWYPEEIDPHD